MPKLGQVFLKNKHIQKKISEYVLYLESDYLVEIGPGTGAITSYIYASFPQKLMMVEIDERLIRNLNELFPFAKLVHNDFLKVNFDNLNVYEKVILFGNIPYYITSPIIFKFLEESCFGEAVFMVQQEYYEVLVAKPKTNRYSCMSVLVQSFLQIKKILEVGKNNFYPVPKVDSVVMHLVKFRKEHLDLKEYSLFLRKCFSMPRKTLWNNLKKHFPKEILEKQFLERNIGINVRPDEMSVDFFIELFLNFERR